MFNSTLGHLKEMVMRRSQPTAIVYHLTRKEKIKLGFTIFSGKVLAVTLLVAFMKLIPTLLVMELLR